MAKSGDVVVVGGGISGLACCVQLHKLGVPVTLLEASECAGGLIQTVETEGFLFESGPQSFQATETLLGLIREMRIEGELCAADPHAPRYVLRHGRLQKIPMSPQAILSTSLLGIGARWRVVSEALRKTTPPSEEESIAAFVRRKFGHEILEYLVSPFVSGVYAGDPEKLSLRAAFPTLHEWEHEYGSVLRGAMKSRGGDRASQTAPSLCSFRRGMSTLPQAMARQLGDRVQTKTCVESIEFANNQDGFRISAIGDNARVVLNARAVVMAAPAHISAPLLKAVAPDVAQKLSGIAYASLAVFAAGYYTKQVSGPLDGFGVLIPRCENHRTLGIVWNTSLFPGRAPDGQMVLTSFIGGATDLEITARPKQEIAVIVQKDHERILGITGPPIRFALWTHQKALPQYNLGHGHVVQAIRDAEQSVAGLYFAGNYLEGPSIGKCVERGFYVAEKVKTYLGGMPGDIAIGT